MYCKVCGKDLNEKDKFCSNCGTKVPVAETKEDSTFTEVTGFVSEKVEFEKEECEAKSDSRDSLNAARKIDFDWDLGGFPPEKEISPGKADFNWSAVVEEKKGKVEVEDNVEEIFSEEDLYRGEPASFDWGLGATTRIEKSSIENATASEDVIADFEPVTDIAELIPEESMQGKEEASETVIDEKEQERRRIDKFYTLNKKNEEFQALLDQEYERLRKRIHEEQEAQEALDSKYEKLEKARDSWENADLEPVGQDQPVEELSETVETTDSEESKTDLPKKSTKEPVNCFDSSFEEAEEGVIAICQPIGTTIVDATKHCSEVLKKDGCAKKGRIKYSDIFDLDAIEELDEEIKRDASKNDGSRTNRKPARRGGKVFLNILIFILVVVVVLAGILIFAKDSTPAKYIQTGIDKVTALFTGEKEPAESPVPPDVTSAMGTVIETEISKNKNIGAVKEGENLGFAHDDDYGIEGFLDSTAFVDSVWFTDDDGNTVNYGNAIVGDIISYYSQLVDFRNGNGEEVFNFIASDSELYSTVEGLSAAKKYAVTSLELGEIRVIGDNYYVLVQVSEIPDEGEDETTGKKIIHLVTEDKAMKIADIKDI